MRKIQVKYLKYSILLVLLWATPANANIGVPMIFITLPGMMIALIPIIVLESKIFSKGLNSSFANSLKLSSLCNLGSTLIGIPIAWLIHAGIFMVLGYSYSVVFPDGGLLDNNYIGLILSVTVGAPWLGPIEKHLYWMIPAASLSLLIPYFFGSWYSEYLILRKLLKSVEPKVCLAVTRRANLISYFCLAIFVIIWLIVSISEKRMTILA